MIVVADTTPLNYLVLMQRVVLLKRLYGRVIIPHAVHHEMLAIGAPTKVQRWATELPDWVEIVSAIRTDVTLPQRLGAGECEAICVALTIHADVVLMDDLPGRLAAEERGLFVSGTLAVLLQASRAGLLNFEEALTELKGLRFRVSDQVAETMRALAKGPSVE